MWRDPYKHPQSGENKKRKEGVVKERRIRQNQGRKP